MKLHPPFVFHSRCKEGSKTRWTTYRDLLIDLPRLDPNVLSARANRAFNAMEEHWVERPCRCENDADRFVVLVKYHTIFEFVLEDVEGGPDRWASAQASLPSAAAVVFVA